jgi:L,D-peptidoglycan transpeptidase YkuD (ErfK/YbiS/YcfS/YnhG family)
MRKLLWFAWLFIVGCVSKTTFADLSKPALSLGQKSSQALRVEASTSSRSVAQRFEFKNGDWQAVGSPFPVVVGVGGTIAREKKIEGDKKTPEGQYLFLQAFAREEQPKIQLPVQQITGDDKWIDDPNHKDYNRWVRGATTAKSYEELKRTDDVYNLFLVINFNTSPTVPAKGSAIFVHSWRGEGQGTAGCIAMEKSHLQKLAEWLDPNLEPMILIGTTK